MTRCDFVLAALEAAAATAACAPVPRDVAAPVRGPRITARPGAPTGTLAPGITTLGDGARPDGLLFVPTDRLADPVTLVVSLHGAGGRATRRLAFLRPYAEASGFLVLATQSRGATWDAIRAGFGPDVRVMDRALARVFAGAPVAADRVFLEGFSDGASYALGLGIGNGDLFRRIVAFSPGMVPDVDGIGRPEILITHGTADEILPVGRASRLIVPALRGAGYRVEYREHALGHTVPPDVAHDAMAWLLRP